jgi:MFS family permease
MPAMSTPAAAASDQPGGFLSRAAVLGVFLPALCFEIGIGAITPMVAVRGVELGASLGGAGVLAALLAVGQIAADGPAGALAARIGDRRALLIAAVVSAVALVGSALASSPVLLGVAVLVTGAGNAVYMLARQAYLTEITPPVFRARAMSTLGGVGRIGQFVGPFLGAAVVHAGGTAAAFWLAAVVTMVTFVVVLAVPDVAGHDERPAGAHVSLWRVLVDHRRLFATLGIAVLLVGATRGARQVVLPLWGEHLGLAPATTSLVFGLAGAVDTAVFYPAGKLMDRRGRLWVAIPSMVLLGLGIAALPLTHAVGTLAVVAMVIGFSNGIGSGMIMTLGADTAPRATRAQFLGVWRIFTDSGAAAGPLVVAAGAALGSLAAGIVTAGGLGLLAAAVMAWTVPRWSVHANARTRLAAGLRPDGRVAAPPPGPGPRPEPGQPR